MNEQTKQNKTLVRFETIQKIDTMKLNFFRAQIERAENTSKRNTLR